MRYKNIRNEFVLLAILLLGLFLRIYDLSTESIWFDEGASIMYAELNIDQLLKTALSGDFSPPLYYGILHYWIGWFGESEFAVRSLSVFFGFFSIIIIYLIGSLLFNKKVGLLSALILSLSKFHIYYSQEARGYELMAFLTLLSFYFFIKILQKRNSFVSSCYIISTILLMYTHIYGIFIIIAQNIYIITLLLLSHRKLEISFKRWILFQSLIVIAYVPWVFVLIKQVTNYQSIHFRYPPKIMMIFNSFREYSGSWSLLILFLIFSFLSIVTYQKTDGHINWKNLSNSIRNYKVEFSLSNINNVYFLLVWLFTPIILAFVISKLISPIYTIKYTIGASLALYLLVAKGLEYISKKYAKFHLIKVLVVSVIVIFSLRSIWKNYSTINKEQWREAINYINTNAKTKDLIVIYPGTQYICFIYNYYSQRTDLIKAPFLRGTKPINEDNIKGLKSFTKNYKRVWVIQRIADPKGIFNKSLNESNDLVYQKVFHSKYLTQYNKEIELSLFSKKIVLQN